MVLKRMAVMLFTICFFFAANGSFAAPQYDTRALQKEGWDLYQLKKYNESIEKFNEALKIDRDNPMILEHLALAHYELNHYKEAIKYFSEANSISPSPYRYKMIGWCYWKIGEPQLAIEAFKESIKIRPDEKIRRFVAKYYLDLKDYDAAIMFLEGTKGQRSKQI